MVGEWCANASRTSLVREDWPSTLKRYWTECGNCGNRGIRIVASVGQNEMIATAKLQGGTDVRTVCTDQLGISLWGNATLGLLPSTIHSLARCFWNRSATAATGASTATCPTTVAAGRSYCPAGSSIAAGAFATASRRARRL